MYFTKVILHKYKRFSMHSSDTYEEDLSNFNILTWRNGYGKSSLIYQINVLPIDKRDFEEDGYKQLFFTHNHREYILTSSSSKHSLLEDGEELNVSFNKKTYLEIVKDKFKITPNVLNYVNGYSTLTKMSPNERKEVLFNISQIDYSYALGVFNKLVTIHRDSIALLKYNSGKLNNIMDMSKEDVSKEDYLEYKKQLEEFKEYLLKNHYNTNSEYNLEEQINKMYNLLTTIGKVITEEELQLLEKRKLELVTEDALYAKEINLVREKVKNLNELVDDKLIKEKQEELSKLEQQLNNFILNVNNNFIKESLVNGNLHILETLNKLLQLLHTDEETLNSILDNELEIKLQEKIKLMEVGRQTIRNMRDILESVNNLNKVKCDNCGHAIDMNLKSQKLQDEINKREVEVSKLEDEVKDGDKIVKTMKRKLSALEEINLCLTFLGVEKLNDIDTLIQQQLYMEYSNIYQISVDVFKLKETLKTKKEEYNNLASKGSMDSTKIRIELNNLYAKDRELIDKLNKVRNEYKEVVSVIEKNKLREEQKQKLREEYENFLNMKINNYRVYYNEFITNSVNSINQELDLVNNNIKHLDMLNNERKNLTEEIAKITEDIKDYKILIDKLSPKNGLIAKSINSFIGVIVEEMNTIINTVWSYDMKIMNCDVGEGGDLDFKFKVLINNIRATNDVSNLSTSMRDIVDLAFRLVYIKYMDLNGIPLVLDEFGSSMDKEHATKAFDMVEDVLRNSFEQIFLVSHFDTMYGRFRNVTYPSVK